MISKKPYTTTFTYEPKLDMANAPSSLTHDFLYFYEDPQGPNRPSQIGSKLLEFDANGNPTVIHDTATGDFRRMIWDEENRLMFLSDNGNMHHFVYDHRGERVIKSNSGLQNVFMDGLPVGTLENNRRTVIYVSPYFVMRDGGFTKHYFAGTQRVLSKFGTGRFHNRFTPSNRVITAGNKNYIQRQQQLRQGLYDPMRELQIPPGNPTQRPNITRPDYTGQPRPTIVGNYEIPRGWPRQPITAPPGGPPGPPIQWGPEITNDNVRAGYTYLPNSLKETAQFFFHPDHLGSTTLITDRHGNITQFITLMPFGELLVSEHLTSRTVPFLFTGKEMDSETGLYYFGYRYFDPRIAKWLGVDPLWEWYPHIGGFVYTANNPIRFVDPDGRRIENPRNIVLSNRTFIGHLREFDREVARISGLDVDDFTFIVTGGDRFRRDGSSNHYSVTSGDPVQGSVDNSLHLQERGAWAVDLRTPEGISNEDLREAARETGFRISWFNDGRNIHLEMGGQDGRSFESGGRYFRPSATDFCHAQDSRQVSPTGEVQISAPSGTVRQGTQPTRFGQLVRSMERRIMNTVGIQDL